MTDLVPLDFAAPDLGTLADLAGCVAVLVPETGQLDPGARRLNRLTRGAVERLVGSEGFEKGKPGDVFPVGWPAGMAAEALVVVKLPRKTSAAEARRAGAALAKAAGGKALTVHAGSHPMAAVIAEGITLRTYSYDEVRTAEGEPAKPVTLLCAKPEEMAAAYAPLRAAAEGVVFTRDLTNAPANVLTTTEFARRLTELRALGLEVEVLDEAELERLGMRTLLGVGQGSESPSHVVVMQWKGAEGAPFALVGKGVVFDTGGISIKPAAGMEEMTMDMGGAGVVAGVMKTLALRKAKAHVVGLVGLVENMPDGRAQRPGDVVRSMKGDTVEVINTDAEGRLVLADVLWYAQERFQPSGMIDLATLTGAIIIALGHEKAGVFANDDRLADAILAAAGAEDEGAWRMPLAPAYDKLLKSRVADMKNVGGRPGGSITAAQFLQRFVKEGTPWAHLDIAGVASVSSETAYAPAGATGWGVRALNRLIRDRYEG
jgi:leucyl aminopeptidase